MNAIPTLAILILVALFIYRTFREEGKLLDRIEALENIHNSRLEEDQALRRRIAEYDRQEDAKIHREQHD